MRTAVYFDLETGGLLPTHPDIQLAAVAINEETWEELATFQEKIIFNAADAEQEALRMNHYEPAEWSRVGCDEAVVVANFADFLDCFKSLEMMSKRTKQPYKVAKLVGHNAANFDGPRLMAMFGRHQTFLPADPRVRCTQQRAMWWFDERGRTPRYSYKLTDLCNEFAIPFGTVHEALADVRLTIALARKLKETT